MRAAGKSTKRLEDCELGREEFGGLPGRSLFGQEKGAFCWEGSRQAGRKICGAGNYLGRVSKAPGLGLEGLGEGAFPGAYLQDKKKNKFLWNSGTNLWDGGQEPPGTGARLGGG